jgi:hypothetical protein
METGVIIILNLYPTTTEESVVEVTTPATKPTAPDTISKDAA